MPPTEWQGAGQAAAAGLASPQVSNYLVFVSKHFKGYEIMKDIMAAESSTTEQGVPSLS